MSATDSYAEWDAAYVLGALTAPERAEYEEHLASCPRCQAAVAELAGLPGLLAQVPPGEALAADLPSDGDGPAEPPHSLMPVLPVDLEDARRRRGWAAPLAAAAAALVLGGVGGYAASSLSADGPGGRPPTSTTGSLLAGGRLAFTPVEPSLMTAVVDVVPVSGGTELRVECQYARATAGATATASGSATTYPGSDDGNYHVDYAIWVVGRDGTATQLRDWTARPDRVMHPVAMSKLPVAQIGSVEIRRVDTGATVMRASLA